MLSSRLAPRLRPFAPSLRTLPEACGGLRCSRAVANPISSVLSFFLSFCSVLLFEAISCALAPHFAGSLRRFARFKGCREPYQFFQFSSVLLFEAISCAQASSYHHLIISSSHHLISISSSHHLIIISSSRHHLIISSSSHHLIIISSSSHHHHHLIISSSSHHLTI